MTYKLIYQKTLTEHATDDDIQLFVNNATDIQSINKNDGRTVITLEDGTIYIYEPNESGDVK